MSYTIELTEHRGRYMVRIHNGKNPLYHGEYHAIALEAIERGLKHINVISEKGNK